MKPQKNFFFIVISLTFFLLIISIFGSSLYFFLGVSEDKIYGDENVYKNTTNKSQGYKESFLINKNTNEVLFNFNEFFLIIIKIFGILIIPVLLYFLVINKDTSILEYFLDKIFGKK